MKTHDADWRTKASLLPGADGTLKEYDQYGEKLLCVRYRYDQLSRRRVKTVELIVEETVLPPKAEPLDIRPKRYACRDFTGHPQSRLTCSQCGWPKNDHKQFRK